MLTATKQANNGYWIASIRKNVYSLEEINYYVYNHIDQIYRDFFCEALFSYMEEELDNPSIADKLRDIDRRGGGIGDFIRCLFNETCYYNGRELTDISVLVSGIDHMGKAERLKIQADSYFRSGQYNSALHVYLEILRHMEEEDVGGSFYGRVAYAAGVIYARMFMSKSANSYFSYAYDLSPDPVYAKACVYMSILTGDDEELLASIVKFKITDDALDAMRTRVQSLRRELESSEEVTSFMLQLSRDDALSGRVLEEWKNEYYNMMK